MDLESNASPSAESAGVSGQFAADAPIQQHTEDVHAQPTDEGQAEPDKQESKPEKTPEQREIDRLRRKLDRVVRQREEARARLNQTGSQGLTNYQPQEQDSEQQSTSDALTLSRAELQKLIEGEAKKLAPQIQEQQAVIEHRRGVVEQLAKTFGQERFDSLAADLDEALGGLADQHGRPKPATDAIFEAEDPAALIEYLADPENEVEAEAIARMSPVQAGRAIAKLESKISSKKASDKPQPSKAPEPLEAARGRGNHSGSPDPTDLKAWIKWENQRERESRRN